MPETIFISEKFTNCSSRLLEFKSVGIIAIYFFNTEVWHFCYCLFFMGLLPIDDGLINRMNEVIIDFVNGRERKIARERWFMTREMGGYGLTDLKIMNLCIKASWIRRWYMNKNIQDYS